MTVVGAGATDVTRQEKWNNKQAILKTCAPFMDCITEINNTQVDNAKDLDVVMPMYNLIEYSDNYSKTPWTLYHICRDVTHRSITDSESFKFKSRFLDNTNNADIINAEIAVSLK